MAFGGPVGAVPGALAGGRMSVPFAMAAINGEVDIVMSSAEFLNEELEKAGLDFEPEAILQILSDDEKYKSIRNRAVARGNTVMVVDAAFGGIATNALRALKVANRVSDKVLVGTELAGEVAAGAGGESLARSVAGQEQDPLETGIEAGVSLFTTGPTNLASTYVGIRRDKMLNGEIERLVSASNTKAYFINDGRVDADGFSDFIETATNEQLLNANIRVDNDPRMLGFVEGKLERAQIENGLPEGASDQQRAQLIELETRLKRLDGNTNRGAESVRKKLRAEIDDIVENIEAPTTAPVEPSLTGDPASPEATVSQAEIDATQAADQQRAAEAQTVRSQQTQEARSLRQRQEAEGVYFEKSYSFSNPKEFLADVLNNRTKLQRKWLRASRLNPRSVFDAVEAKQAYISAEMGKVQAHAKEFGRIEASIPKESRNDWAQQFDAFLRGGEPGDLMNPQSISLAREMRTNVDNLSLRLVNEGAVKMSEVDKILSNLDTYLTRSYKLFEQRGYKNQLASAEGQEIVNKAKLRLKADNYEGIVDLAQRDAYKNEDGTMNDSYTPENNPDQLDYFELLDQRLDAKVSGILNRDGNSFASNTKLASKDLYVLKERKEIPVEIRALMGEFSDPLQNYAQTILRQSQLAENHRALTTIRDKGKGVYLFDQPQGAFDTLIASEGSESLSPLNGLYTTKEVAEEFNKAGANMDFSGPSEKIMGNFFGGWLKVTGSVKWAKTIGSAGTHFKNVLGNLGFMWSNGHTDLTMVRETLAIVRNDLGSMSDADLNAKMQKYISLGIVKQNVGLGEVRSMLGEEGSFDDIVASRLDSRGKKMAQSAKKTAEDYYQAEDDFFKIIAYENEVRRYSRAEYGVEPSKLTEQQSQELDAKVAEIVKNTYPTYSRTPEAVRFLKLNPVIGNFVSFQAESYRTAFNIIDTAQKEIRSDNPEIRKIGAKRLAGVTTYQGAKTGLIAYGGSAAGAGLMGVAGALNPGATEIEKQREKDIRMYLPFWSEDSDLYASGGVENGKFRYRDLSASDPFGGISKVMNAIALSEGGIDGEVSINAFIDGYLAVLEPFVGVDIATRRGFNLLKNEDDYGRQIYNPEDSFSNQTREILSYGYEVLEPGTFTSLRKIYNSDRKVNELFGQATGLKEFEIDFADQFGFKAKALGERMANARDLRKKNADYETDFYEQESVDLANDALEKIEGELREFARAANRLGVPEDVLIEKMRRMTKSEGNVSLSEERARDIYNGIFVPLTTER